MVPELTSRAGSHESSVGSNLGMAVLAFNVHFFFDILSYFFRFRLTALQDFCDNVLLVIMIR